METYFLPIEKIGEFTAHLSKFGKVYRCEQTESGPKIKLLEEKDYGNYSFPDVRTSEPAKFMFIKAKRKVAEYFDDSWRKIEVKEEPKVLFGLKGCDLAAIKIWDNVFRDDPDYKDVFYSTARENTLLVGADCTGVCETCFCNLLGNKPYPKEGEFDLSISPVDGGFGGCLRGGQDSRQDDRRLLGGPLVRSGRDGAQILGAVSVQSGRCGHWSVDFGQHELSRFHGERHHSHRDHDHVPGPDHRAAFGQGRHRKGR